jgi:PKD repeat protein
MKKTITLLSSLALILFLNNLCAGNNSIGFIQGSLKDCSYDFRDTTGKRTYAPTSYTWDFGDGSNPVTTQHATHTYNSNGTYLVIHTSSNGTQNDTAFLTLQVNCSSNKPLKALFGFKTIDTQSTQLFYFYNQSEGKPTSFVWDFGDANVSNQENPIHIYGSAMPQSYTVSLKVSDSNSSSTFSQIVYVKPFDSCGSFYADFHWQYDSICKKIRFINTSNLSASNYKWNFGDGSTSTNTYPIYTYANKGYYDVKLKASNQRCSDSITQNIYVSCRTCFSVNAKIELFTDSSAPGKAILFNFSAGNIASHYWDFGDGYTSTGANPNHNYTSPGHFILKYVVRDSGTCTDTAVLEFDIDSTGHIKRGLFNFSLQVIDRTNGNTTAIKTLTENNSQILTYPNPAQNKINFKNQGSETIALTIFTLQGQAIATINLDDQAIQTIDTSTWASGIYLTKDQNGKVWKLVKE